MQTIGKYVFDSNTILEKSYDLLCTFFANKEIARRSDPDDPYAPLALLEKRFFEAKISRLLIEIAASLRVMDDQMTKLPITNLERVNYYRLLESINQYDFGLFDDLGLTLRETCNKIIHSDVFEPRAQEGVEGHESDGAYLAGVEDKSVKWKYFANYVRLSGKQNKNSWYVLLDIEVFITAIFQLLG
jgi:hypothetical protein